ncbi:MAG: hypothetical protein ACXU9F_01440 [Syntrophales bacterium]
MICWKKLGQLYCPEAVHPKLATHAANPLAVLLEGDVYRVFFSGRDLENRSSVGFVDVDIVKREVVYIHDKPAFEHGTENSFYSHGVSIGNCYEASGQRYILFMGWQCPPDGHWRGDLGRLVLEQDFSLRIDSEEPFMVADAIDPVSLSYPWVMQEENGNYHMWYGSTETWDAGNGEMLHVLNHATSNDGDHWMRHGLSVPYQLGVAQAFSRPTVVKDADGFHMWFSYRSGTGQKYRIGYAVSATGKQWELKLEDVGIDVSVEGWDSEMIEYPFVFDHKGERYMLYNGNGNGKTGIGLALLEREAL